MSDYNHLCTEVSNRFNAVRGIAHLLCVEETKDLYLSSTPHERVAFNILVRHYDIDGLKRWINKHPSVKLEDMKLERLRRVAASLGILYTSRLSKSELIAMIQGTKEQK